MSEEPQLPAPNPLWDAYGVTTGKIFLFGANLLLFIVAFALLKAWSNSWLVALPLAILFSAFYVTAGAHCIRWAERLHGWGFPGEFRDWSTEVRFQCGGVWPLVLLFWSVVAVFNRVVSRLYR